MLKRGIGRWDLVFLIINSVIGAGIFGLPAKVFALSGVYSLLAFVVCAVVMMTIILVFAEVSSRFDQTGGPYLYVYSAFGPPPAFIIGWLLMLTRLFSYATLINLMVIYLSFFSESFAIPAVRITIILGITGVITIVNLLGIKGSTRLSTVLTISKLVPLAMFIGVGIFFVNPDIIRFDNPPTLPDFSSSALLLIFAFGGFEAGLVNTGEISNPRKNLPFALITAAIVITTFYILIQFVSIGTLPELATSDKPLADAAVGFMGWWGGLIITLGAVVSILGTLNVQILSGSRLPFALSVEQQFPQIFSNVHVKYRTPVAAILFFSTLIAIVSIVWTFMSALAISVIARLVLYALVCASLIKLRRDRPDEDYFKIPFGNVLAVLGIVATIWLLSGTQWAEVKDTLLWTALGLVIYGLDWIFRRSRKPAEIG